MSTLDVPTGAPATAPDPIPAGTTAAPTLPVMSPPTVYAFTPAASVAVQVQNWAHSLLALLGVLLAAQAPITAYALSLSASQQWIDLAFGALGLVITLGSKAIDSAHSAAVAGKIT